MMREIFVIVRKEVYSTVTNRNLMLVLLAAPLALTTILGLAFGGDGNSGIAIRDIPVAIVNLDEGVEQSGQVFNNGQIFIDVLIPAGGTDKAEENSLHELIRATRLDDVEEARAGVAAGIYVAAIIIPADFSARQAIRREQYADAIGKEDVDLFSSTTIEVYANSGLSIQAGIVRGVTERIANQMMTGNIALASTISALIERSLNDLRFAAQFLLATVNGTFDPDFSAAFASGDRLITIEQIPLTPVQQRSQLVQVIVTVGSAQAVFFALFTGGFGLLSIYDEKKQGTLQRLLIAPIPRAHTLIGKVAGNLLIVMLQITLLLIGLMLIASLIEGRMTFIFGMNFLLLLLVVVALALCVSGVGITVVGLARSREQASIMIPIVNMAFGMLGGSFGFVPSDFVSRFSLIYWGTDALNKLSNGDANIGLNLLTLIGGGVILFLIGSYFFNRRIEV